MLNRFRKVVQGREIGKPRGESHLKVVLLRVGLMFNTSLCLIRGLKIIFLLISPRITMIEVLILNLKSGEMLIRQKRDQLVIIVVTNMWENVLLRRIVSMVVVKLNQAVVVLKLQKRIVSIHSRVRVTKKVVSTYCQVCNKFSLLTCMLLLTKVLLFLLF